MLTVPFDIRLTQDDQPRTFDLQFQQSGLVRGSIPVIISLPFADQARAIDSDGDSLTWSLIEGPSGLTIDPVTGVSAWPTEELQFGQFPITIRVEDGRGGFDEQEYVLDVNSGVPGEIRGRKIHDVDGDSVSGITVDVVVPGNTDPYLAGMPDGATASAGDTAPDESPILVEGLRLKPATSSAIRAEGGVFLGPGGPAPDATPDGDSSFGHIRPVPRMASLISLHLGTLW